MVLDAVTYILFLLLAFSFIGVAPPPGAAPGTWTPTRYGYGFLGLLTLIAFLAHLFGKFGPNGVMAGGG